MQIHKQVFCCRNAHTHPERQGADGASVTGLVWLDDNNIVSVGGNDGVIKVGRTIKLKNNFLNALICRLVKGHKIKASSYNTKQ